MFGFLIALISGALMSIQGVLNTGLTRQTGIWLSAGWVQISAFFTCVVLWLFSERTPISSLLSVRPRYMAIGGVLGAFITWTVIRSMDRLRTRKSHALYCSDPDHCGLSDRAVRMLRRGKSII